MLIEVYDVGGTLIRGAVGYLREKVTFLEKVQEPTEKDFCAQIRRLSPNLRKAHKPDLVSIIVPGPVKEGVLLKAPPLGITSPININYELSSFDKKVYVGNDLNAAVQAELSEGIGKYVENFYLLTISTGIGAGIVLNGIPVSGTSGEFGHNVIERYWGLHIECGCGNYGCWGSMCSGKGIEMLARKFIHKRLTPKEVFGLDEIGNRDAKDLISKVRDYNAQGIGMMVNAFEVDKIAVMGSIGLKQFDKIIPSKEEISRYTVNKIPDIIPTSLGDDIGLIGAYYYGMLHTSDVLREELAKK